PLGEIEAVFLTHFHSDHIDSLGELMLQRWANGGHAEPLSVIGPSGVEQVVRGFNLAYAQDSVYRVAHHGEDVVPPSGFGGDPVPFELNQSGESQTVYNVDGLRIVMFPVKHDPVFPAVGYRFEFGGRSVVLSGDTAFSERLIAEASGADLLVHEALNTDMVAAIGGQAEAAGLDRAAHIMDDIPSYHATPAEAARVAKEAGVDMLVLSHLVPAVPDRRLVPYFLKGTKEVWDGPIIVAEDGDVFSMRATEERIRRSDLR
ncbi:MAG: MBL fold metallo-hydrolase, partial [Henriciella sp.]